MYPPKVHPNVIKPSKFGGKTPDLTKVVDNEIERKKIEERKKKLVNVHTGAVVIIC